MGSKVITEKEDCMDELDDDGTIEENYEMYSFPFISGGY